MKLIDADKFLEDLENEGCDVINADARCPLYTEFGYSYELIKRVLERQDVINGKRNITPKTLEFWYSTGEGSGTDV